jgi:predicted N-acyltransferase
LQEVEGSDRKGIVGMDIRICTEISEILDADWNALVPLNFPFARHEHFLALESNGCLKDASGWYPIYMTVTQNSLLVGATFLYFKTNSFGEFIFDFQWANAYQRRGISYFPKIVSAIPFTPVTGSKILVHPSANRQEVAGALLNATSEFIASSGVSSCHFLFLPFHELDLFEGADFMIRHSYQFHWRNQSYKNFDDFLRELKPKRRRQIQLERRQISQENVVIKEFTKSELTEEHAIVMHELYLSTHDKKESPALLTREFFVEIFRTMNENILFIAAMKDGEIVAASLNFYGNAALYGRYWGCKEDIRNLHFELCYYRLIDFSIQRKFSVCEAGAQGTHKIPRGFLPTLTYSAHKIMNPMFQSVISRFIAQEKTEIAAMCLDLESHLPYQNPQLTVQGLQPNLAFELQ